jgi:hypothetical protein
MKGLKLVGWGVREFSQQVPDTGESKEVKLSVSPGSSTTSCRDYQEKQRKM